MFRTIIRQSSQIIQYGLVLSVTAYQKSISLFLSPRCRFYPSCSCYAKIVLKEQPLYKSIPLILWRLVRCQPFSEGGFDYPPKHSKPF
jgi:putative membrane protein insertion efficiency factor